MMTSSTTDPIRATSINYWDDEIIISLSDGRRLSIPVVWFPRLAQANHAERADYELLGDGEGIHWPQLDEDISVAGLLAGKQSTEFSPQT